MSYFPCDEGLYKKKYLNDNDCGIISGMEMVVDEIIDNFIANNEITEYDLELVMDDLADDAENDAYREMAEKLNNGEEITFTKEDFVKFLNTMQEYAALNVANWVEIERDEALVAFIDDKYMKLSDKELQPYWDKSAKDEYTGIDPSEVEVFTTNANGKPRPVWYFDNSWQYKTKDTAETKEKDGE